MSSRKIRSALKKKGITAEVWYEWLSDCYGGGGSYFIEIDEDEQDKLYDIDPNCNADTVGDFFDNLELALEFVDQLPSLKEQKNANS